MMASSGEENFRNDLMPLSCVYFGYTLPSNFERLQIRKDRINEIKGLCMDFLIRATEEDQTRLPEYAAVFQAMTSISPKGTHRSQDIAQLAERFKNISSDIDAINNELRRIKLIAVPDDLLENPIRYWTYLQQYKDAAGEPRFANISRLAVALYSLSYSNAEVERIFSKMNYLKTNCETR